MEVERQSTVSKLAARGWRAEGGSCTKLQCSKRVLYGKRVGASAEESCGWPDAWGASPPVPPPCCIKQEIGKC